MQSDPFDLVGDVLDGQFRVDAFIDEGNLSVVYKGHHLGLSAPIAIKCLNLPTTLDGALVQPLVDAFNEAARLHYRLARRNLNIAQSIACGTTLAPRTGVLVPYTVREWFDGESLASELGNRRARKCRGRSPEEALSLLESAFEGVAFAHREGVTHLSLNPSNLFLARRGETVSPKILDFGVSRTMNDMASELSAKTGNGGGLRLLFPAYAAPEQLDKKAGPLGPWTDVYALALIVIECLSDRVVMSESDTGALVEHALDAKRRPTPQALGLALPFALDRALARAVSLAPRQRQQSADELWDDLKKAVRKPALAMPVPPPQVRPRAPTVAGIGPIPQTGAPAPSVRPPNPAPSVRPLSPLPPPPQVLLEPPTPTNSNFSLSTKPESTPSIHLGTPWERFAALTGTPARPLAIGGALLGAGALVLLGLLAHAPPKPAFAAAMAGASLPVPPAPEPEPATGETALPAPPIPFSAAAAWRALYATSRDVAGCRRGKVWGGTTATVTFDNDGSVSKVAFRRPFKSSTTATCVTDVLESVHAPPFGGHPGVVNFWFYVRPR